MPSILPHRTVDAVLAGTMDGIAQGRASGRCHDGTTAFIPSISSCEACHPEPTQFLWEF